MKHWYKNIQLLILCIDSWSVQHCIISKICVYVCFRIIFIQIVYILLRSNLFRLGGQPIWQSGKPGKVREFKRTGKRQGILIETCKFQCNAANEFLCHDFARKIVKNNLEKSGKMTRESHGIWKSSIAGRPFSVFIGFMIFFIKCSFLFCTDSFLRKIKALNLVQDLVIHSKYILYKFLSYCCNITEILIHRNLPAMMRFILLL